MHRDDYLLRGTLSSSKLEVKPNPNPRCMRGDDQLCGSVSCTCCEGAKGGFADYIRIKDARFAYAIPDALDSAGTAPLLCGGQTVWTPLRQQTKAGDKVGILGLGGLGSMAIKFARALGTTVTALSSTEAKREEALGMGAHSFVAHADQEALDAAAGTLDFILVTLATQQQVDFTKFFGLLRPRGTMCFVGMCPPITADVFTLGFTMLNITTSNTGGRKEMVSHSVLALLVHLTLSSNAIKLATASLLHYISPSLFPSDSTPTHPISTHLGRNARIRRCEWY